MTDSPAWRQALYILAGTTLLRLLIGAIVPLFPDETYYWDWSRTLMAGYFDHPPMIAVLVRAGTVIFGNHAIGVRFFSILAGSGAIYAVALTSRELAGDGAAKLAVLLLCCMPLAAVGLILATPDAPMLCAASWALYAVVRAVHVPENGDSLPATRWWLIAGLAIGLAMASKYTSILIPASIALACILHPRLQNKFGEAGPYFAVIVASLVLLPVLIWNWRHDWVSFKFQLGHGLGDPQGGVLGALNRELELLGGQIGLVSPILFYFVARAIKRAFEPTPDGTRLILGVVATCCLGFFIYSATHRRAEANWPAIAWIPAVILLATEPVGSDRSELWLKRGLQLGGVLSAIVCIHAVYPIIPLRADRDQVAKAYGWELLGNVIDRHLDAVRGRQSAGNELFVAGERYQDASELAFHLKAHQRVYSLNLVGRANQYDLWTTFNENANVGAGMILVLDDEKGEPRDIRKLSCCFHVESGESVALMRGDAFVTRKRLWYLSQWNGEWPPRNQPFPWTP
ncbi:MAG TPA: glycosyltransferase family 39 protein [Gemmatimonadaceae bacterium]|nr:glycosyltransferase family 39 protein [Gemmatimonadaceae bacterium]